MNTKHTPGPWQVNPNWLNIGSGNRHLAVEVPLAGCGFGLVASLENSFTRESQDANARLIAASPELFEACLEIVKTAVVQKDESGECVGVLVTHEAFSWAMDAIAKATGETL